MIRSIKTNRYRRPPEKAAAKPKPKAKPKAAPKAKSKAVEAVKKVLSTKKKEE